MKGNICMSCGAASCSRQVQLDQVVQSIIRFTFESALMDEAATSLSNLFQCLTTPHGENTLTIYKWNSPCCNFSVGFSSFTVRMLWENLTKYPQVLKLS